jgi:FG-GAP repeat
MLAYWNGHVGAIMNRRLRTRFAALAAAGLLAALVALAAPAAMVAVIHAALPSDFNGDGYADLAIGVPFESVGDHQHAGAVNVLYGSTTGLRAAGNQLWTQNRAGILDVSEASDEFGAAVASGDFDADGYADIAVGAPGEVIDGTRSGAVNVIYGSSVGLTAAGNQLWSVANLPDPDLGSTGTSLAAGDFDGDGYWDLAIGAPSTERNGTRLTGTVVVLPGGPDGLASAGALVIDRSMIAPNIAGIYYQFGSAMAAGDLDGNGYADLAITASGGGQTGGDVSVVYGSGAGLSVAGSELWTQDSPGIHGIVQTNDDFGSALAIGDFDGNGFGDLAVGVPGEPVPHCRSYCWAGGAVNVIYGSAGGLTADGNQCWTQNSPGVPGSTEYTDTFGRALAAGDFDGNGADDLAVGIPGKNPSMRSQPFGRGAVVTLYGSTGGLSAAGAQRWTQASPNVAGSPEPGDWFGESLASANFGRSARDDLAIGVPRESHHGVNHAGMVNVLYGQSSGLAGAHAQGWSQASPGVAGKAEHEYFGLTLGS